MAGVVRDFGTLWEVVGGSIPSSVKAENLRTVVAITVALSVLAEWRDRHLATYPESISEQEPEATTLICSCMQLAAMPVQLGQNPLHSDSACARPSVTGDGKTSPCSLRP